jgi:SAM-dependent methyltransferase
MAIADKARKHYMLATGDEAANRLLLLDRIFGASTRELLKAAGISPGMKVAEIGCGSGLVSLWLAKTVGATGTVTAADSSGEQLQLAEKNASDLNNISFHRADAYATGLPRESFDLVYSRFLMCHLREPLRALAEMRALLRPGGILVCEDHDDGGIFTEPPTRAYQRLVEISQSVNASRGLDSYIGLKLPRLFHEAGFTGPDVRVMQLAFLRGEEKRFWELTLREAAPAIFAAGASSPEELESICAEMQAIASDESVLLMLARVTQVWARR